VKSFRGGASVDQSQSVQSFQNAFSAGMAQGYHGYMLGVDIVIWAVIGFINFRINQKAGMKYPWFSWIPFLNLVPFFRMIQVSLWNIAWPFLMFIPIIQIVHGVAIHETSLAGIVGMIVLSIIILVLEIRWCIRFLKAFDFSPHLMWFLLVALIPFVNFLLYVGVIVLLCFIAFRKKIVYHPDFAQKRRK
jgi:hypothetical protein